MGEAPNLTNGAIQDILAGMQLSRPVLQVLNMKKLQSDSGGPERYRLQVSDGLHYQPCMLATQMNEKVHTGELCKWTVLEVERYIVNTIHQKKIIILIVVRIIKKGSEVSRAIGQPKQLDLVCVGDGAQGPVPRNPHNGPPGPGGQGGGAGGAGGNHQGGGGNQGGGGGGYRGGNPAGNQQQQGYRSGGVTMHGASTNGPSMTGRPPFRNAAPPSRPGFDGGVSPSRGQFPGSSQLSQATLYPISSLNPYQSKWTIRVRVASKPSIREWSNSRGQGKVFNVDLVDESGEIRACAFNQVAEKLNSTFEMGKVYYISRGRLRPANKQFNTTKNDYELTLNEDSEIELCTDSVSDSQLPTVQYNFRHIADLENIEPNQLVDVIGVCKGAGDLSSIITKTTNRKLSKRELHLVDRSGREVTCTLWGAEAEGFNPSNFPVVAIKGARVSDFGGRSLSTLMSSLLMVDPDIPEAHQLRGWFDNVGKNEQTTSLSDQRGGGGGGASQASFLTLQQVKELDLGHGDKPDYFSCKASISFVKSENCLYKACPNPDCNKKVTEMSNSGEYHCDKCNQTFPNFKYRMILALNTSDFSSNQWVTCFQDTGTEILGCSAQELGELREQNSPDYDTVFQKANFKDFIFRVRAKIDNYNDERRLKCYCMGVQPVNYAQEARRRIEEIKQIMSN